VTQCARRGILGAPSTDMLVSLSMNFNNHGTTHTELCDNLRKNSLVTTPLLEYAFRKTDRADFDPSPTPYEDKPHDIGCGATITSAHMHCIAIEALAPAFVPEQVRGAPMAAAAVRSILDVGSGSGYVAAVAGNVLHALRANPASAAAAGASRVIGVDIMPGLVAQARDNVTASNAALTALPAADAAEADALVSFHCADAFAPGAGAALPHAPYDAIHCGVASATPPARLLALLKPGGRAVVPVHIPGSAEQELLLFTRKPSAAADAAGAADVVLETPTDAGAEPAWLEAHFNRSFIMRCVYSQSASAATLAASGGAAALPAINPRLARLSQDGGVTGSKHAAYFKPGAAGGGAADDGLTPVERAAAQEKLREAARVEHARLVQTLSEDLKGKMSAMEQTGAEVRRWQNEFVERTGGKPSMRDMAADPVICKLLALVKELRGQVTRAERALDAVQSKSKKA
jgi:protein-L-isoaspartate O-methyltransferase